jgi:AcrR family transcriptional regulator
VGPARVTFAAAAAEAGLSAATLVQRFGSKRDLLLAADKRGIDLWVGALDRSTATSPLARVVEGLVLAVDPQATPEQMANSVAMLQLDRADPDFHAETLRGARAVRARIERNLSAALAAGELRSGHRCRGARKARRNHLPRRDDRLGDPPREHPRPLGARAGRGRTRPTPEPRASQPPAGEAGARQLDLRMPVPQGRTPFPARCRR